MAKDDIQVNVRLPAEIVESLKAMAEINNRSMTAEIVSRLEASFPPTLAEIQMDSLRKEAEQVAAHEFRLRFDKRALGEDKRAKALHQEEMAEVKRRLSQLESEISARMKASRDRWAEKKPKS